MNPAPDWIDQARGLLDMFVQRAANPSDEQAHGNDCRWCPLCQAAAVLRGERPEVTAAIADVLSATATALRAFAEAAAPTESAEAAETAEAQPSPGDPPPVVQQIDIA